MDVEDILNDSLTLFDGERSQDQESNEIRYGDLLLTVAPKASISLSGLVEQEGKAITLLADQLFSPSLVLAERIQTGELNLRGRTVLELGAGCALPSLLASTLPFDRAPRLVVVTDYPDPVILGNLQRNVDTNAKLIHSSLQDEDLGAETGRERGCHLVCRGYSWGANVTPLLELLSHSPSSSIESLSADQIDAVGFDVLFLSDLLHFDTSHDILARSIASLLSRKDDARVYVSVGAYTKPDVVDSFFSLFKIEESQSGGTQQTTEGLDAMIVRKTYPISWEEIKIDSTWRGETTISGIGNGGLGARKGSCRLWAGKWCFCG